MAIILICLLTLSSSFSATASAVPSGDATTAVKKLQQMQSQMSKALGDYDSAKAKLDKAEASASEARAKIDELDAQIAVKRKALGKQADYLYRCGGTSGYLELLFSSRDFKIYIPRSPC